MCNGFETCKSLFKHLFTNIFMERYKVKWTFSPFHIFDLSIILIGDKMCE